MRCEGTAKHPNSLTRGRPPHPPRPLLPRQSPGAKLGQAVMNRLIFANISLYWNKPGGSPRFNPMQPAGGSIGTVLTVLTGLTVLKADRIDEVDRLTAKTKLVNQSTRSAVNPVNSVNPVNTVQDPSPPPQADGAFKKPRGMSPGFLK